MDVLIKRPTAVAKIRKLAKRTGETLTDAVEYPACRRLIAARLGAPAGVLRTYEHFPFCITFSRLAPILGNQNKRIRH